jgi:hypothetical protein
MKYLSQRLFWPYLLGILVILPAVWPLLQPGIFPMHDYTHTGRVQEMAGILADGHIPPRWSPHLGFGYGMPLFSFYAPLPYYVGAGLTFLGLAPLTAVKGLFILTFYAGFLSMYALAKPYWGKTGALFSAILFTYIPYRAVNVYVRGALGELVGITMLVVALLTFRRMLLKRSPASIALFALSLAGLLLSHNIMALLGLITLGFWIGYQLLMRSTVLGKSIATTALGISIGLMMSAYFIVPAFLEKQFTSVEELTKFGGSFQLHFVYLRQLISSPFGYGGSIEGPHDGITFEVGKIHLFLLVMVFIFMITRPKQATKEQQRLFVFAAFLTATALFMTSFHSQWWWNLWPILEFIQFPWRFLGIAMIFISLSGGAIILYLPQRRWIMALGLLPVLLSMPWFKPESIDSMASSRLTTNEIETKLSRTLPDYLHPNLSYLVFESDASLAPPTNRFELAGGETANPKIIRNAAHRFEVEINDPQTEVFIANIFAFPGWSFTINDEPVDYEVDTPLPRMRLTLPQNKEGRWVINGHLAETPLRLAANTVTVAGWIGWLLLLWFSYRKQIHERR